jgi:hypothetical protein
MVVDADYVSPDGALRFIVRSPDGDVTMGFDGFSWHTHGDILAALSGQSAEKATERFIADLISSRLTIAISKVDGVIQDVWITDNPAGEFLYCSPEEVIDFRLWDGTPVEVARRQQR